MSLTGLRILLAEDNPTNQMVAVQMLESLDASVTLAVDGAEALERLEAESFDVALIDIEMPRISGIDLIRRLRADDSPLNDMPLIALTAYVMREHRAAIGDAGADGIIAKPILSIQQFGEDILKYMQIRAPVRAEAPAGPRVNGAPKDDGAEMDAEIFEQLLGSFDGAGRDELCQRVCEDIESARSGIVKAMVTAQFAEIRSASHILISVAGVIGATKLQSLAQCLNSAGHASDIAVVRDKAPELSDEAEKVLDFVRAS